MASGPREAPSVEQVVRLAGLEAIRCECEAKLALSDSEPMEAEERTKDAAIWRALAESYPRQQAELAALRAENDAMRALLHIEHGRDGGFHEGGLLAVGQGLILRNDAIRGALAAFRDGRTTRALEILKEAEAAMQSAAALGEPK